MSTFQRRGHTRATASGKIVQVTEHGVTRDSGSKFLGSGLTGAISRAATSSSHRASQNSLAYEHPVLLDESGELADKKPKSCMVPNARCPVCNAVVFYYRNSSGSSVFFDEVGKPWPKHPCTDVAHVQNGTRATIEPAIRNRKVDVYEDFYGRKTVVLRVSERIHDGHVTDFTLVDPSHPSDSLTWGTQDYVGSKPLQVGQIVYVKGDYLSFLDQTDCTPRYYYGVFRRLSASVNIRHDGSQPSGIQIPKSTGANIRLTTNVGAALDDAKTDTVLSDVPPTVDDELRSQLLRNLHSQLLTMSLRSNGCAPSHVR